MDSAEDVDSPSTSSGPSPGKKRSSGTGSTAKPALVKYMEQFDHGTLLEMTRIVSKEGSELIERQISALFGDINELQTQMQVLFKEVMRKNVLSSHLILTVDQKCSIADHRA